jgi:hypothetical protein
MSRAKADGHDQIGHSDRPSSMISDQRRSAVWQIMRAIRSTIGSSDWIAVNSAESGMGTIRSVIQIGHQACSAISNDQLYNVQHACTSINNRR